jgi:hypothetical protein
MTVRIRVDFSSLHAGRVRARIADADDPLFPGDDVVLYDPDDDLEADGSVAEMSGAFAYIDVNWTSQRGTARPSHYYQYNMASSVWITGYKVEMSGGPVATQGVEWGQTLEEPQSPPFMPVQECA